MKAFNPEVLSRLKDRKETGCSGLRVIVERDCSRTDAASAVGQEEHGIRHSKDAVQSLTPTPGEDPDDSIDPDDGLSVSDVIPPPPEMPTAWWTHMVLDPDETLVTPEDCKLVLECISRKLSLGQVHPSVISPCTALPPSTDGPPVHLSSSEDDSGAPILPGVMVHSRGDDVTVGDAEPVKMWTGKVDFMSITKVGQLHEAIAGYFGAPGWAAMMECWHKACGIEAPAKEEKRQPKNAYASNPAEEPHGKPDSAEQLVTRQGFTSQARVMRWFERPEPVPPAWRHQETVGEKEWRESMEETGTWCG